MRRRRPQRGALAERLASVTAMCRCSPARGQDLPGRCAVPRAPHRDRMLGAAIRPWPRTIPQRAPVGPSELCDRHPMSLTNRASATLVAMTGQIFGLPKPFSTIRVDTYVCSTRFRPMVCLLYEHMFSQLLRDALETTVALLTLEDGEEAYREAEWEGRTCLSHLEQTGTGCPQWSRRLSAPVASGAGYTARTVGKTNVHGTAHPHGAARSAQQLSAARGSQQAARASRSTCSARSRCTASRSAATTR
jgi:hypothetical protein